MRRLNLFVCLVTPACLQTSTIETTAAATTEDTSSSTTTPVEDTTAAASDDSTTAAPPCDDDPACGPDETPETCPEQCPTTCGDGVLDPDELCDNGNKNRDYWPNLPPDDACTTRCNHAFTWCGDAILSAKETCDNGNNTDPPYATTLPPNACTANCTPPGYCGDARKTGEEACDDGIQTATCELDCNLPTCGDDTLNTLAGEACDDGNKSDGDGCSADCNALERLVFTTSAVYYGDMDKQDNNPDALAGLPLADLRCQTLAQAASLPGTYKAWLSTSDQSPSTRFDTSFNGLYRLPTKDFPIVAEGWQALTSESLQHPIDVSETGASVKGNVWTNTLPDGTTASDLHCAAWTASDDTTTTIGKSSATDNTWTNLLPIGLCSGVIRLYCFQDG